MAKVTKQYDRENETEDRGARGVPTHGVIVDDDPDRLEDERKDRQRLRQEFVELSPEEITDLMTQKVNLKEAHESEVRELRNKYRQEKQKLDEKLSAGGGFKRGETAPTLLSNETDEEGRRRYTAGPL